MDGAEERQEFLHWYVSRAPPFGRRFALCSLISCVGTSLWYCFCMKAKEKEEALRLRIDEQLSYSEISKKLKVPKSTLSGWLRDYPLSRERISELQHSEASREKYRNTMQKKRISKEREIYKRQKRKIKNISKQSLFAAGLLLYAAEGGKTNYSTISLANTDPKLINFFIWWLDSFLGVAKESMRFMLHVYDNMNVAHERAFWKTELGIKEGQFYKDQVRSTRKGSFSYRNSSRHGTCQLYFHGVKEKTELMLSIKAFLDTYSGRGL